MIFDWGPKYVYPFAERYVGRNISPKTELLRHRFRVDPKVRHQLLRLNLARMVAHAKATVPYYRDVLKNFDPAKLESDPRHLEGIPHLTKEIIQEQGDRLLSEKFQGQFLHSRKTGGSTGISAVIRYSQEDLDWTAAVNLCLDHFTGRKLEDRELHLSAEFKEKQRLVERCYGLVKEIAMNRSNLAVGRLDDRSLNKLLVRIAEIDPYIVQAHPSTMDALAQYIRRNISLKRPLFSAFESTGEVLYPEQAKHIENYLGCKVYNRYGSAEFGVIAHSHLDPMTLEVIEAVAYPEEGDHESGQRELVLTGLMNFAMPLIRYRTGDLSRVHEENGIYYLTELNGRVHDLVKVQNTLVATHYLQDVLDRAASHAEFQILYRGESKQVTRILVVPTANPKPASEIEGLIRHHLGTSIPVQFVGFDDLVKVGWREKFRRSVPDPKVEAQPRA